MSGLNAKLAGQGRYFGTAVRHDQLAELPALRQAIVSNCGAITPEIELKWAALEWERGRFNFQPVDDLLAFADKNGLAVHGHTLLWGQSIPPWAQAHLEQHPGDWSIVATYMTTVLSRYRGRIHQWDLVNEAIDTSEQDNLRRNPFYKAFGPQYIERAMEEARAHAPDATFILNDYSLEYDNPVDNARRRAMLSLLEQHKRNGTAFEGLGMQAHLDLGKGHVNKRILRPFLEAVADLGMEIYISELDVQEADLSAPRDVRDQRVSDEVQRFLDIVLEVPNVKGVTTWGLSDNLSWLNSEEYKRLDVKGARSAENRGLPFDGCWFPRRTEPVRRIISIEN
ncbi:endo-1,4-beta-xylanase [Rhizobium halophytocola]|uniref:Beta-xylanase n=1 Tax=Rhizobium halophytocola TaxID=735519 RepID=A0ABS4E6K3_9HYPH|nr:endo-1,4-beta-xylanase [Rhizobium halophytocola]MBP1853578.1 endo-1,4-beta-xylanase [Rhizobium halophytocola]